MVVYLEDISHSVGWSPIFAGIIYKTIPSCLYKDSTITPLGLLYIKDDWITWLQTHCSHSLLLSVSLNPRRYYMKSHVNASNTL